MQSHVHLLPVPLDVCSTWQPCSNINSYQGFGIHFQSIAATLPQISLPLAQLLSIGIV